MQSQVKKGMGRQPSRSTSSRSTIVGWSLLLGLTAPTIIAVPAQSEVISMYSAKCIHLQQSCNPYENCTLGQARLDSSKIVAQAATSTSPPPNPTAVTPVQPPRRHIVRGAGRGAALGAVGGAIAGDAGKGAAAGAAMGGMAGGFRRRDERRQQGLSPR